MIPTNAITWFLKTRTPAYAVRKFPWITMEHGTAALLCMPEVPVNFDPNVTPLAHLPYCPTASSAVLSFTKAAAQCTTFPTEARSSWKAIWIDEAFSLSTNHPSWWTNHGVCWADSKPIPTPLGLKRRPLRELYALWPSASQPTHYFVHLKLTLTRWRIKCDQIFATSDKLRSPLYIIMSYSR